MQPLLKKSILDKELVLDEGIFKKRKSGLSSFVNDPKQGTHIIEVLLDEARAFIFKKDEAGNTPLHLAALSRPCNKLLAQTLLAHGAHLDTRNADGDTFETLLQSQRIHDIVNPIKVTRLSCLAARAIKKNRIPYVNRVPQTLYGFIDTH